jgi:hypothetical protein
MFAAEDITFLVLNGFIIMITILTLYSVTIRRILKAKKYTIMMTILLLESIVHSIATAIHFIQTHYGIPAMVVRALMQQMASLILCTISLCQAELLNYFSVIAPFWNSQRVSILQICLVLFQLVPQLPLIVKGILESVQKPSSFTETVSCFYVVENMGIKCLCEWSVSLRVLGHRVSVAQSVPILSSKSKTNSSKVSIHSTLFLVFRSDLDMRCDWNCLVYSADHVLVSFRNRNSTSEGCHDCVHLHSTKGYFFEQRRLEFDDRSTTLTVPFHPSQKNIHFRCCNHYLFY